MYDQRPWKHHEVDRCLLLSAAIAKALTHTNSLLAQPKHSDAPRALRVGMFVTSLRSHIGHPETSNDDLHYLRSYACSTMKWKDVGVPVEHGAYWMYGPDIHGCIELAMSSMDDVDVQLNNNSKALEAISKDLKQAELYVAQAALLDKQSDIALKELGNILSET